ncbi:hypothetical protein ACLOJK_008588 [Asimina triloba]
MDVVGNVQWKESTRRDRMIGETELQAYVASPSRCMKEDRVDPRQDFVKIRDNQKDFRDEEYEEVWCDKENEVGLETL